MSYAFATLKSETDASTSSSSVNMDTGGPESIEYNARYFCGTIVGQDGPLRPGRYNSDINIFNRQLVSNFISLDRQFPHQSFHQAK